MRGTLVAATAVALAAGGTVPANAFATDDPLSFSVRLTMTGIPAADGGERDSACSGALIARQWVITAGHCFRDAAGRRVERPVADVTTASVAGDRGTRVVAVRQSPSTDVALAKLAEPITGVPPIRLSGTPPQEGAIVRFTGYGSPPTADPSPSTRMRTGRMVVADVSDDVTGMRPEAPAESTTPCPYDSGGPFLLPTRRGPVLVAVVSNGPSCPHTGVEHAARTDNITAWISTVMRQATP